MINITTQGGARAKTRGQGRARLCAMPQHVNEQGPILWRA
jgi:hypothetical protein